MDADKIFSQVDHTILRPTSSWDEVKKLCEEAIKYKTASVCIPPCYVGPVKNDFPDLNICTVVGFPLGYSTKAAKIAETLEALENGANEIDMVINICDVKNKNFQKVTEEIAAIKKVAGYKILKVIVETCFLTGDEKIAVCRCVTEGGADYIKTSTGFGSAGAQLEDITLFRKHIGENVKIKASGGIKTREDFEKFMEAGCDRIGASAAVCALGSSGNP